MNIEKKLDVLDWMKIHYLDRECLNKTEEKELDNFINELKEAINYTRCSLQLPDANKRKEIENEAYFLNLQNLSGREDFEEAFRLGIMTGINETIEYIENKAIV
jgi:hypothetical protein